MQRYEYKVIPAPTRGEKARGVKATPDRFALALTNLMNDLGADGWSYVRADALPCEERSGLTGTKTTFQIDGKDLTPAQLLERLGFARAMVHHPPILLLDEPAAHLDYHHAREVVRRLREAAADGRTVLATSHDDRLLAAASDVIEVPYEHR